MRGFAVDPGDLDTCRRAIAEQAGVFQEIAGRFSDEPEMPLLGTHPYGQTLAGAVIEVHRSTREQLDAARRHLLGVADALDRTAGQITRTETDNVDLWTRRSDGS